MMYFDSISTERKNDEDIMEKTAVIDILRNSEMLRYYSLHLTLFFFCEILIK